MTEGVLPWEDNVRLEMQQRGHGVGVHTDIGGQSNYDCTRFAAAPRDMRGSGRLSTDCGFAGRPHESHGCANGPSTFSN